jgi:hypothetical protein
MSAPSRAAVHESGHAIVAIHDDLGFIVARLTPGGANGYGGYCVVRETVMTSEPKEWLTYLVAGKMAVRVLEPSSVGDPDATTIGPAVDYERAYQLAECINPSAPEQEIKAAEARAWYILETYKNLALTSATELNQRGVLHAADLKGILSDYYREESSPDRRTA